MSTLPLEKKHWRAPICLACSPVEKFRSSTTLEGHCMANAVISSGIPGHRRGRILYRRPCWLVPQTLENYPRRSSGGRLYVTATWALGAKSVPNSVDEELCYSLLRPSLSCLFFLPCVGVQCGFEKCTRPMVSRAFKLVFFSQSFCRIDHIDDFKLKMCRLIDFEIAALSRQE